MNQMTLIVETMIAAFICLILASFEHINNQPNDWFLLAIAGFLTLFAGYLVVKYVKERAVKND